ncbi:MAG: RluA family pseudouridine synthase [Spirochaetaceae bacterium]
MTRKREIIIQNEEVGEVLLNWLTRRYTYHDKDKWEQYINEERILINGSKVKPRTLLQKNDIVIYYPEPIIEPPVDFNYKTIYEDDDLLVINKPCDLPCHPGGIYFENTLWHLLKQKYPYISLVNRLDRETSGVMLIAKTKESAKFYFNKMMEREIEKEYIVLVHGDINHELDAKGWLLPDSDSVIRKKRKFVLDHEAAQPEGEGDKERQFCHSKFYPLISENGLTLLKCQLLTGRTHQIRATICSLGFPVVGDKIYGLDDSYFFKFINDELTSEDWFKLKLKNQSLHSYKTTIPMIDGKIRSYIASAPLNWPITINNE